MWSGIEWVRNDKPSALGIATGAVAGLAAITPAAGSVGPLGAVAIGSASAGVCYWASVPLKRRLGYDDSLDVFGVHGVGGLVGTILLAIFGSPSLGGRIVDRSVGQQLTAQLIGAIGTAVYSGVVSYVLLKLVAALTDLRVSEPGAHAPARRARARLVHRGRPVLHARRLRAVRGAEAAAEPARQAASVHRRRALHQLDRSVRARRGARALRAGRARGGRAVAQQGVLRGGRRVGAAERRAARAHPALRRADAVLRTDPAAHARRRRRLRAPAPAPGVRGATGGAARTAMLALQAIEHAGLALTTPACSPIFQAQCDSPRIAFRVAERMRERGFYCCICVFPAVPMNRPGIRFTVTRHNQPEDVVAFVSALAETVAAVRGQLPAAEATRPMP